MSKSLNVVIGLCLGWCIAGFIFKQQIELSSCVALTGCLIAMQIRYLSGDK